jgi:hypothetical protein
MVKEAVKRAGVSRSSSQSDLPVESFQLVLQALARKTAGGELDFQIPFRLRMMPASADTN